MFCKPICTLFFDDSIKRFTAFFFCASSASIFCASSSILTSSFTFLCEDACLSVESLELFFSESFTSLFSSFSEGKELGFAVDASFTGFFLKEASFSVLAVDFLLDSGSCTGVEVQAPIFYLQCRLNAELFLMMLPVKIRKTQ